MLVLLKGDFVCVKKAGTWESHSHSMDLMDQLKTNSFVREYIRSEAQRGYDYKSISKAFQKHVDIVAVGAKYVTLAKFKRYSIIDTSNLQTESISKFLKTKNFKSAYKQSNIGIVKVFANNDQLQHLELYGNELVLMDACGSLAGYYLVTLLVRDNFRCWIPGGQFLITKEHSDLYIFAFNTLAQWTNNRWNPSTFLIDGSKIEMKAIAQKFNRARVLRCTRHSTENLKSKLSHVEEVLYHMEKAVFAESLSECQANIQESISKCPYADLKRYLLSKWTWQSISILSGSFMKNEFLPASRSSNLNRLLLHEE